MFPIVAFVVDLAEKTPERNSVRRLHRLGAV
jgi:hypothetical protein